MLESTIFLHYGALFCNHLYLCFCDVKGQTVFLHSVYIDNLVIASDQLLLIYWELFPSRLSHHLQTILCFQFAALSQPTSEMTLFNYLPVMFILFEQLAKTCVVDDWWWGWWYMACWHKKIHFVIAERALVAGHLSARGSQETCTRGIISWQPHLMNSGWKCPGKLHLKQAV